MEQHIAPYDIEWMKMAMLKHEEIFKQQVYELHRLYQIQKMLMKKIPKRPVLKTDNPPRNSFNQDDDEAIDLTLGLGTYNHSEKSSKKLSQTRLTSDSVISFSSSSTGSSSHLMKKAGINDIVVYQEQAMEQQPPWLKCKSWV